jgi:hypothetical protein
MGPTEGAKRYMTAKANILTARQKKIPQKIFRVSFGQARVCRREAPKTLLVASSGRRITYRPLSKSRELDSLSFAAYIANRSGDRPDLRSPGQRFGLIGAGGADRTPLCSRRGVAGRAANERSAEARQGKARRGTS